MGDTIQISGTNFSTTISNDQVLFNGIAATITQATSTTLSAKVPSGATTGPIRVSVGGQSVTSGTNFTVSLPAPTISGFSPPSGAAGTSVTITGTNFDPNIANDAVAFHGTSAVVTSATSTQLVATVPVGATTGTIKVTVGTKSVTSSASFTVIQAPNISAFSPAFGAAGTAVEIDGTNFSSTPANDLVAFNGTQATVSSATTTAVSVTQPVAAATGPVSVTVGGVAGTSRTNYVVV
ncbi:MAG TPA: IPT/TIG domain-containing protein, partial [Burkholderiales bacterium]|nr:IPT/TIG domain-containing protein [Burkholderiales bacterium]